MIEPTIEALTTSWRPSSRAKKAMISSGALPNVTFRRPPMPGPGLGRDRLGGLAHHRRAGDHAEGGRRNTSTRRRVRELERDRGRDEDAEVVDRAHGRRVTLRGRGYPRRRGDDRPRQQPEAPAPGRALQAGRRLRRRGGADRALAVRQRRRVRRPDDPVRADAALRLAGPAAARAPRGRGSERRARPLLRRLRGRRPAARGAGRPGRGGRADPPRSRLPAPASDLPARRLPPATT